MNQHFSNTISSLTLILVLPIFGRSASAQPPDIYWETEDTVKERFVVHKYSVSCGLQIGRNKTQIDYSVEYPVFYDTASPLFDSLSQFVRTRLDRIDSSQSIPDWLFAQARSQFNYCERNNADVGIGSGSEDEIRIVTDTLGIVGICSFWWSPGGAHPLATIHYLNLDAATGKTLKLSDLLVPDYKQILDSVGETEFRYVHKIPPIVSLADQWRFKDNKFSLNDNFLIKNDGLAFMFNEYEVSSYANPAGGLTLSYYAIKGIIRKDGPLAPFLPKDK